MRRIVSRRLLAAALLLIAVTNALPHDDDHSSAGMDMATDITSSSGVSETMAGGGSEPTSYFAYQKQRWVIVAHIALMVLAWAFILPIGVMFGVARSRYTIPTQFLFLVVNTLGVLLAIIYNTQTPDLYENNAHHRIGWIATGVMVAQVIITLLHTYAGRGREKNGASYERAAFLPVPTEATGEHPADYPSGPREHRWSGDSGQGTERNSSSLHSYPSSPTGSPGVLRGEFAHEEGKPLEELPTARHWFGNSTLNQFFSSRIPHVVSDRMLRVLQVVSVVIDRICLPFGFIAVATGAVTYSGIFRGQAVFSGLAHFIKGGIFFWYGLVVLGRFMGCWADFGWAWNAKPPRSIVGKRKAAVPTGEFIESSLIFLYGSTNVFLEHLGGWGGAWSPSDLEHVSIAFMFFGGGLCGMLVESKRVKNWLNITIFESSSHPATFGDTDPAWRTPSTHGVSLNPMPALIIFLLGLMMGSHQQEKMISSMMHRQWGTLLAGGALARGVTYILLYTKPPTSYLPSRPPSEIIGSFCLVSGGLMFMMTASDIIEILDSYKLDAMFMFNVTVGLTAFIMAWEILVIAAKAWAVKREAASPFRFPA